MLAGAVGVHDVYVVAGVAEVVRELGAVGRPVRTHRRPAVGQVVLTAAVGVHGADLAAAGKRDLRTVRRPGRGVGHAVAGQGVLAGAVGVHDIDVVLASLVAAEDDVGPVGGPGGVRIGCRGVVGQVVLTAAVGVH